MSDAIERFTRDVDDGFQPAWSDSVAALDALREARAEIDRLTGERDDARQLLIEANRKRGAMLRH
jgi:hypothetical protein